MATLQGWLKKGVLQLHQTNLVFTLSATVFLLVLVNYFVKHVYGNKSGKRKLKLPPGPPKLPIIGNLHQFGGMPHITLTNMAKKLGPIIHLQLGEVPAVFVSNARLAKEVMKTHDLAIASRPQLFAAQHMFHGCTGVTFTKYSAYWREVRKICIIELLSAKKIDFFTAGRQATSARLVQRIAEPYPAPVNISSKLKLYPNDNICRAAFGRSMTDTGEYARHRFDQLLLDFQIMLGGFSLGDYFPSHPWIHSLTGVKEKAIRTTEGFSRLFDEVIQEHLNRPNRDQQEHKDIIDVLMDLHKSGNLGMPLTLGNIKGVLLDMFAGGTDTSFITLDWAMVELMRKPKALEKVQSEIRSIMGGRASVTNEDLAQMNYLKAVVKESFRLHPAAPLLVPRESMEDVVIDGYDIPAKTQYFVNVWAIGRDPEIWENPESFDPDRFLNSTIDFRGQDYELVPMGAGRRMCAGFAMGAATIEMGLAQVLHSFDFELPPGVKPEDLDMTEKFGISVERKDDLMVIAKPLFIPK